MSILCWIFGHKINNEDGYWCFRCQHDVVEKGDYPTDKLEQQEMLVKTLMKMQKENQKMNLFPPRYSSIDRKIAESLHDLYNHTL